MPRSETPRALDFNENATFTVRRPFKMSGRSMAPGQPFCRKNLAVSVRHLWRLYNAGYLTQHGASVAEATEATTDADSAPAAMGVAEDPDSGAETASPVEDAAPPQDAEDLDPDELSSLSLADLKIMADGMGVPRRNSKDAQIAEILGTNE